MSITTTPTPPRLPLGYSLSGLGPVEFGLEWEPHYAISGPPGAGKTALLAKFARWGLDLNFEVLWFDAEGLGPIGHGIEERINLRTLDEPSRPGDSRENNDVSQPLRADLLDILRTVDSRRELRQEQGVSRWHDLSPAIPRKFVVFDGFSKSQLVGDHLLGVALQKLLKTGRAEGIHVLISLPAEESSVRYSPFATRCVLIELMAWTANKSTALISAPGDPAITAARVQHS